MQVFRHAYLRKKLFVSLLLILFKYSCFSQALIKGKIIDKDRAQIMLYEPINDFCNNHSIAKSSFLIKVNADGSFEKKIQIHSPIVITIIIGQIPVWILLEPNDTTNIEVNTSKYNKFSPNGGLIFTGRNADGNALFNNFNFQPINKIVRFQHILDSLKFKETLNLKSVDYALSKIVYPFDSLLDRNKITKKFYDVIVNDTRGILLTQLVKFAFFEKKLSLENGIHLVNQLYQKYPVTEEACRSGLYGSSIAYYYYYSKARPHYPTHLLGDSVFTINGRPIFVNSNLVPWLYAPKNIQEMYWAISLIELKQIFSTLFGNRDKDAYLTVYPNSKMKQYLSLPYFNTLETAEKTSSSTEIKFFIADSIKSFSSLISNFRGKKLFVDLWATWCVACKLEFSSNYELDKFCKVNNIDRLYIAFELSATKINFKKDIYSYNLSGTHVLANDSLVHDIVRRFYSEDQTYSIPRYILINENGDVVNADASRPSSGKVLFTEMKSAFKLND